MGLSALQQFLNRAIAREIPRARFESFFQVGQVKTGRVLQKIDSAHYLVQLGPFRLLARSELPLNPNDRILARVLSLQPNLHLQLLPPEKEGPEAIRGFAKIETDVTEEFNQTVVFYLTDIQSDQKPILRVSYFPGARKEQRRKINRISLFIDLKAIGRTEILVEQTGRGLKVDIASPNLAWTGHLQRTVQQLRARLSRLHHGEALQLQVRHRPY